MSALLQTHFRARGRIRKLALSPGKGAPAYHFSSPLKTGSYTTPFHHLFLQGEYQTQIFLPCCSFHLWDAGHSLLVRLALSRCRGPPHSEQSVEFHLYHALSTLDYLCPSASQISELCQVAAFDAPHVLCLHLGGAAPIFYPLHQRPHRLLVQPRNCRGQSLAAHLAPLHATLAPLEPPSRLMNAIHILAAPDHPFSTSPRRLRPQATAQSFCRASKLWRGHEATASFRGKHDTHACTYTFSASSGICLLAAFQSSHTQHWSICGTLLSSAG